jgi:hypothetical protein
MPRHRAMATVLLTLNTSTLRNHKHIKKYAPLNFSDSGTTSSGQEPPTNKRNFYYTSVFLLAALERCSTGRHASPSFPYFRLGAQELERQLRKAQNNKLRASSSQNWPCYTGASWDGTICGGTRRGERSKRGPATAAGAPGGQPAAPCKRDSQGSRQSRSQQIGLLLHYPCRRLPETAQGGSLKSHLSLQLRHLLLQAPLPAPHCPLASVTVTQMGESYCNGVQGGRMLQSNDLKHMHHSI